MFSPTEMKALLFAPMATGSLSFFGSSGMIVMILWFSRIKLSAIARRILFGLCVYDVLQSLASLATTFPVPPGQGFFGASGTVGTCDAQGFVTQMGITGSLLYNCSLSVYYVSVIKFGVKDKEFKRKIEFWCHFIPNVFAIGSSIFLQVGRYFNSIGDVGCWISATPIECLIDPDIDCDRGGKEALVYRKWLGVYVFFMSVCVIFINMMAIIHFVMEQKRKSDRNRLRSGNSDTACRFKMSRCFICVKSCVGKIFKTVKKYACCDECTNTDARANKLGQVMVGNDDSMHRGPPSYDPTTNMLSRSSSDPLPPAPQACLTPLEIMATPTFLDTTAKQQDAGKNGCCGDEENGQNQNRFKPRESLNAVKPPPLGSVQAEGVGDQGLCSWTGAKLRAPPSRSAKGGDSYHFNAAEVRAKIRRESLIALDTQELNDTERKNSTSGEELQSRPSTSRKSRLRQKSNNRGWSLHGRTSAATSSLPVNEEDGNDDVRNEDTNNSVETEAIFQALLYTGCFFLTYIFSATGRMIQMQGKEVPFAILFLARFFLPLQGFFNIMVYMRPHIISLRRSNPDYSWFKAFVVVFKGGGDNDCAGQGQRSSQQPASVANIRRRQKLAERDHNRRMDEIKRKSMVSEDCIAAAAIQAQEADEESGGKDDSVTHTIGEEAFARRSSTADDSYLIEDPPDNKSASVASHRCFLVCSITKRQD